jgi:hypothetical protein
MRKITKSQLISNKKSKCNSDDEMITELDKNGENKCNSDDEGGEGLSAGGRFMTTAVTV